LVSCKPVKNIELYVDGTVFRKSLGWFEKGVESRGCEGLNLRTCGGSSQPNLVGGDPQNLGPGKGNIHWNEIPIVRKDGNRAFLCPSSKSQKQGTKV